jgi:hypothetical protein
MGVKAAGLTANHATPPKAQFCTYKKDIAHHQDVGPVIVNQRGRLAEIDDRHAFLRVRHRRSLSQRTTRSTERSKRSGSVVRTRNPSSFGSIVETTNASITPSSCGTMIDWLSNPADMPRISPSHCWRSTIRCNAFRQGMPSRASCCRASSPRVHAGSKRGRKRGRESFSGHDEPCGTRFLRKRLPTPSAKRDTNSFAGP